MVMTGCWLSSLHVVVCCLLVDIAGCSPRVLTVVCCCLLLVIVFVGNCCLLLLLNFDYCWSVLVIADLC